MLELIWKSLQRLRRWYNLRKLGLATGVLARNGSTYNAAPRVSAIVQLFNKKQNIELGSGPIKFLAEKANG